MGLAKCSSRWYASASALQSPPCRSLLCGFQISAHWSHKLDARGHIIYMLSNMAWKMVFLTTGQPSASDCVMVLVEFCVKQSLSFLGAGVEGIPAFVVCMYDSRVRNAAPRQPFAYSVEGLIGRLEGFDDLFLRPVLAKAGRAGIGAAKGTLVSCEYQARNVQLERSNDE